MTKEEIAKAVAGWAARGEITEQELVRAYRSGGGAPAGEGSLEHHFTITKVLYGIGGIIVAAGLVFLVAQMWDSFSAGVQIFVTLGSSIALYAAAVLLHQYERLRPVATLFFIIAAVVMPLGIFVTLHHLSPGGNEWMGNLIIAGIPAAVYLVSYYLFRQPALLLVTILLATWALYALVGLMLDAGSAGGQFDEEVWSYVTLLVGAAYGLLAYSLSPTRDRSIVGVLYFLGSAGALGAGFALTFFQEVWVLIYFMVILAAMYLSTVVRSRSLLVFSALGLIAHLTHISFEYFADSLGWPLALIISGFVIIGVGYGTVLLHKRFITQPKPVT